MSFLRKRLTSLFLKCRNFFLVKNLCSQLSLVCTPQNIYMRVDDFLDLPGGSAVKNPPANGGDKSLTPGSGRCPGEGNGSPLQYSCLKNPMDRGAWWAVTHGVAKSWERLSMHACVCMTLWELLWYMSPSPHQGPSSSALSNRW